MRLFDESCKVAGVAGMGQFADETQNFLMGLAVFLCDVEEGERRTATDGRFVGQLLWLSMKISF